MRAKIPNIGPSNLVLWQLPAHNHFPCPSSPSPKCICSIFHRERRALRPCTEKRPSPPNSDIAVSLEGGGGGRCWSLKHSFLKTSKPRGKGPFLPPHNSRAFLFSSRRQERAEWDIFLSSPSSPVSLVAGAFYYSAVKINCRGNFCPFFVL